MLDASPWEADQRLGGPNPNIAAVASSEQQRPVTTRNSKLKTPRVLPSAIHRTAAKKKVDHVSRWFDSNIVTYIFLHDLNSRNWIKNHFLLHGLECDVHKTISFLQTLNNVRSKHGTHLITGPSRFTCFRTCHTRNLVTKSAKHRVFHRNVHFQQLKTVSKGGQSPPLVVMDLQKSGTQVSQLKPPRPW